MRGEEEGENLTDGIVWRRPLCDRYGAGMDVLVHIAVLKAQLDSVECIPSTLEPFHVIQVLPRS